MSARWAGAAGGRRPQVKGGQLYRKDALHNLCAHSVVEAHNALLPVDLADGVGCPPVLGVPVCVVAGSLALGAQGRRGQGLRGGNGVRERCIGHAGTAAGWRGQRDWLPSPGGGT